VWVLVEYVCLGVGVGWGEEKAITFVRACAHNMLGHTCNVGRFRGWGRDKRAGGGVTGDGGVGRPWHTVLCTACMKGCCLMKVTGKVRKLTYLL
jgi:hypothetical protein